MKNKNNWTIQKKMNLFSGIFFLIAGIINLVYANFYVALFELLLGLSVVIYLFSFNKSKSKDMEEFISIITEQNKNITNDILYKFPLPMLVLSIDGEIVWHNDIASEMFEIKDLFGQKLHQLIPELKWTNILKSTDDINLEVSYKEKYYNIYGSIIKKENEKDAVYSVLIYFDDITQSVVAKMQLEAKKADVAIITIDNYDDVFQTMDDIKSQETIAKINSLVSKWVSESKGILKKTESDRYIVLFEHQYLEHYVKGKFDVLDKVRLIGDEIKEPITISIGIGTGGHLDENEAYARAAIEMIWGRGGDQAAIKDNEQFKFYGTATKDYEKSTRVKTRLFSKALTEMIKQAENVILMGHESADYDSFGAAVGLSKAVRLLDKNAYIVLDSSPAIKPLYDQMQNNPEYTGMIISPNMAMEIINKETLLIILDTHRPSLLPAKELINVASKIVLIDHHRRSTEFIENVSLSYLEPYASSTCEMVTEILQYMDDKKKMNTFEAMALYVGILMDTKNFITKTGVRTFEAASYLRRYGINTMEVKKLVTLNFDEYVKRMEIIKRAEIWNTNIAVSICENSFNNMRVVSSQAADEMLNISGIKAAFVVYAVEGFVYFSARSFSEINVQLIMEKLGGGGHTTMAGCQLKNISLQDARDMLKNAIKEYIEENK